MVLFSNSNLRADYVAFGMVVFSSIHRHPQYIAPNRNAKPFKNDGWFPVWIHKSLYS